MNNIIISISPAQLSELTNVEIGHLCINMCRTIIEFFQNYYFDKESEESRVLYSRELLIENYVNLIEKIVSQRYAQFPNVDNQPNVIVNQVSLCVRQPHFNVSQFNFNSVEMLTVRPAYLLKVLTTVLKSSIRHFYNLSLLDLDNDLKSVVKCKVENLTYISNQIRRIVLNTIQRQKYRFEDSLDIKIHMSVWYKRHPEWSIYRLPIFYKDFTENGEDSINTSAEEEMLSDCEEYLADQQCQ